MSSNSTRSGNSNSNSKRSFNSQSSNSNNKRKKTNQKTLGVAWGANSLSSSRSSFRSAPFSDFGSYMAVKNKKLHDQFDAEASSSSHTCGDSEKPIFHGVSIFVDGFTIPSSQELRGYMLKHGGRFENYFSRHHVTHIICSNLPDSKMKNLRSFSGGLPVVKPTWVLDCVAAHKLLSWGPYQLDQLANMTHNQPKLSDFFAMRSSSISQDVCSDSTCLLKNEAEDSELKCPVLDDNTSFNADKPSECTRHCEMEMMDANCNQIYMAGDVDENTPLNAHESTECTRCSEVDLKDACSKQSVVADVAEQVSGVKEFSTETGKSVRVTNEPESSALCGFSILESGKSVIANNELKSSPIRSSTSASCQDMHTKAAGESSGSLVGPSYHCHSTSEDPNFVENYFKSSRLHFIGTWRNRYRKRFASLCNKINQTSSDINAASISQKATIIHVDMDCFFVAVVVRNRPDLLDKPVAVCHSDSPRGTAEISSANYPARDYGVKAGMFVRDAKARCPHLLIVPYNFEAYEEAADQFYNILHRHCNKVQAVSCDEAFLDVTDCDEKDPELLASVIRKEIFETTGCTASAGIAGNLLMARLATRTAKPDGQCYIPPEKVDEYLVQLPIKALPGIGHVLEEKLKRKGVQTCGQLRLFSKESLQREFGVKTGEMLWNYCRGVDNRSVGVIRETKSVGAEVNWGVRFKDMKDCQHFLSSLCKEVSLRLQGCGVQGRTFTLKIKKRREDADEPVKYMGCGDCENFSHSTTVPVATDDVDFLRRITMQLFGLFRLDIKDIRGIGLQVTKLEIADQTKQGNERYTLRSWLASGTAGSTKHCHLRDTGQSYSEHGESSRMITDSSSHQTPLPSLEELDMGVIENLPPELFSEINNVYGGKLSDLISKSKGKAGHQTLCYMSMNEVRDDVRSKQEAHASFGGQANNNQKKDETRCSEDNEMQAGSAFPGTAAETVVTPVESENVALMPSSLSQVDISILQQLPEELRADIIETLPAHRSSNCLPGSSSVSVESPKRRVIGEPVRSMNSAEDINLWVGSPPYWVRKYKESDCLMLNILADFYLKSGSTGLLSSALQCCLSGQRIFSEITEDVANEASDSFCELLRQYIRLKLETDIEEIYVSFRLLKRLTFISKAFSHVYDVVLPHLQLWRKLASVSSALNASPDSTGPSASMLALK